MTGVDGASGTRLPTALMEVLSPGPLVGRESPLAELESALAPTRSDSGGLTLLAGAAGIGKTRLVAELARRAADRGSGALYGRCEPGATVPYEPFVRMLEGAGLKRLRGQLPGSARDHLRALLPELGAGREPVRAEGDPDLDRLRLFDAIGVALRAAAGARPAIVIVEDLHWGEASTLALLAHLAAPGALPGMALVATARESSPEDKALAPALRSIGRRAALRRLRIGGIGAEGVRELVFEWAQRPASARLAAELHGHTGGNPFLLRSTLAHLESTGLLFGASGELPPALSPAAAAEVSGDALDWVMQRASALGDGALELLRAGALLGAEFSLEEARAAVGAELATAVGASEAAAAAGMVRHLEERPGRLAFEHALIRHALVRELSPSRRAMLHLAVARAIERGPATGARSAELARHYGEALALGGAEPALRHARAAADTAARQYAFDEEVVHVSRALDALDELGGGDWRERYDLLMRRGAALFRCEGPTNALPAFVRAADLAEERGDRERLARAGLGIGLERYLRYAGVDDVALGLIERAAGALGAEPDVLAVRVRSVRLLERCFLDSLAQRERDAQALVEASARVGDAEAELVARTARQVALWHPRHTAELLQEVPELVRLAHDAGRLDLVMHLHCTAFGYALELSRRPELEAQLAAARAVAATLRAPIQALRVTALEVTVSLLSGRLDEVRATIASLPGLIDETDQPLVAPALLLWEFMLERERGGLASLVPALCAAVDAMPAAPTARAALAEACARAGESSAAGSHLDVLAAERFADVHEDFLWLSVLTMSASAATLLTDAERAGWLYELLAPHAGRNVIAGLAAAGRPVSHALGLLARTLGRPADACAHFQAAADAAGEFDAPPWRTHALLELGVTQRRSGSPRAAREPLREALDLAGRCGADEAAERARRELVAAGARPRRDRLSGPEALTPSERQVASLAAGGLSNPEIARRLTVSRRTVETHLTGAYRKLGIAGRGELAAALGRE